VAELNWDACFDHVIGSEGGYSDDPKDTGNWTGCKTGVGILKGTMYGVSACAYPTLDIENLTIEEAQDIYHQDYWHVVQGNYLPWGPDLCTFDSGVNSGNSRGAKWLKRAVGATVDGVVGPETISKALAADDHVTIDRMCDDRLAYLKGLSSWQHYGKGWTNRVEKVRKDAHAMVDAHKGEPASPIAPVEPGAEKLVTVIINVPEGVKVDVQVVNGANG
jgi:lysozyme family protein